MVKSVTLHNTWAVAQIHATNDKSALIEMHYVINLVNVSSLLSGMLFASIGVLTRDKQQNGEMTLPLMHASGQVGATRLLMQDDREQYQARDPPQVGHAHEIIHESNEEETRVAHKARGEKGPEEINFQNEDLPSMGIMAGLGLAEISEGPEIEPTGGLEQDKALQGLQEDFQAINLFTNAANNQSGSKFSTQEDAPPGFEGTPRYKEKNTISHRSPRLVNKNTGRYVSAVDRARATQGFINVSYLMQKPKIKVKRTTKASPAYLKNYDPLTQAHAEALVATAGVTMDVALAAKIGNIAGQENDEHTPGEAS